MWCRELGDIHRHSHTMQQQQEKTRFIQLRGTIPRHHKLTSNYPNNLDIAIEPYINKLLVALKPYQHHGTLFYTRLKSQLMGILHVSVVNSAGR